MGKLNNNGYEYACIIELHKAICAYRLQQL